MRKHFLILMLFALLPLAGWAQEATLPADIAVTAPNRTYTGVAYVGYGISSTEDALIADHVVARFYSDEGCTDAVTPIHAGTYYLRYEGNGADYLATAVSAPVQFKINQVVLIYMLANKTQVYDGTAVTPGGMYALNSGDFVNSETLDGLGITFSLPGAPLVNVSQSGAQFTSLVIDYNNNVDYNIQFTGTSVVTINPRNLADAVAAEPTWATPEDQTWDGTAKEPTPGALTFADCTITASDYTVDYAYNTNVVTMEGSVEKHPTIIYTAANSNFTGTLEKEFDINKANLVEGTDYIVPTLSENLTYNGADQELISGPTISNNYGTPLYKVNGVSTSGAIPTGKNAGNYVVQWGIRGDANHNNLAWRYAGTAAGIDIATANAFIISPDLTIEYNGNATVDLTGLAQPTFFGFTSADETAFRSAVTYKAVADGDKVAGTHANAIFVDETTYPSAESNYTITQQKGTLTVNKRVLTITASSKTKKYGEDDAAAEYVVTDPVTTTPYTVGNLVTGDDADDVFNDATLVIERVSGEDVNTYTINISGGAIKAGYDANYDLTENSYVAGQFVITPNTDAPVTIYARSYNMTYGGVLPDFNRTLVKNEDFIVTGLADADDLNVEALQLSYDAGEANADTYPITISVKDGMTLLPAAKYGETPNVTFVPGTLTIAKKAVTFDVDEQIMQQGMVVDATTFDVTAFTADGLLDNENKDDIFELTIDGSLTETVSDVLRIKAGAATSATGILVKVKNSAKAANYSYDFTLATNKGQLTIIAAATLFLNDDSELLTKMTAANNTTPTAVKFGARKFTAEQWNTMVLPFDIAVEDLSANFGYCIVNILNETATTDNNIKFKFHMQGIPANTPFLIKFADDVEISDHTIDLTSLKKVDADDMSVDRTAAGVTFNYDADDAAENAYFKGVYEHQNIQGTEYGVLCDHEVVAGAERTGWKSFSSVAYDLAPFRAYLVYAPVTNNTSTAPMITVEDENGTTAIMSVTSDGRLIEAEGWYTLNGVKLQGVPTEKGIYIHNGKKLVVK